MNKFIGKLIFWSIGMFLILNVHAQFVPIHADYSSIYSFIDELANDRIIDLNSVCKPYSRKQVVDWLNDAQVNIEQLNVRQKKEVAFYLLQFGIDPSTSLRERGAEARSTKHEARFLINPLSFSHTDSLFRIRIEPLWGIRQYVAGSKKLTHFWGGGSAFAYLSDGWSFYANVRDNHMTGETLVKESYFTQFPGGNVKTDANFTGSDFSEMRGGLYYANSWGSIGLAKDHVQWGDHSNGALIFSGRTPSFPMVKLRLNPVDWMQFNYIHGWLVSEVIDSTLSYINRNSNSYRATFRKKFIAANMFSFRLLKATWLSVGNSIVYSDMDAHPAYLIPFMFYKSIDHTVNWGIENQNSQMFINLSIRRIKHLHLYGSFFIDEWSFSRVNDPKSFNFTSQKAGINLSNWPLKNLSFKYEYTQSTPITYKHRVSTTTYESNGYNLGWFMRDNSQNIYASLEYKALKNLNVSLFYDQSIHFNDFVYKTGYEDTLSIRKDKSWESTQMGLKIRYQIVNNIFFTADIFSNKNLGSPIDGKSSKDYLELFTSPVFRGNDKVVLLGFNMGF